MTVSDIAKELKLDRTTVSYVLNDRWRERRIAEKTAARVKEYIEKIQFHQDIGALAMRGKHSVDVAIIIPVNLYFEQLDIYYRLMEFLNRSNLTYVTLHFNEKNYGRFCQELKTHNPRRVVVFAYFLANVHASERWKNIRDGYLSETPCYYHYCYCRRHVKDMIRNIDSATFIDNHHQTVDSLDFLARKGFSRIFVPDFLRGNLGDTVDKHPAMDIIIFTQCNDAFKKDLFQVDKLALVGESITAEMLRHTIIPGKTAVLIPDEHMAVACMRSLRRSGLKLPDDVLVISGAQTSSTQFYEYPRLYWEHPFDDMYCNMRKWLKNEPSGQIIEEYKTKLKNKELMS